MCSSVKFERFGLRISEFTHLKKKINKNVFTEFQPKFFMHLRSLKF